MKVQPGLIALTFANLVLLIFALIRTPTAVAANEDRREKVIEP